MCILDPVIFEAVLLYPCTCTGGCGGHKSALKLLIHETIRITELPTIKKLFSEQICNRHLDNICCISNACMTGNLNKAQF